METRLPENPLVSIIIPARGRTSNLKIALASIGKQTYERIETIVVDDKSPEGEEMLRICGDYSAKYYRNDAKSLEAQAALCRNIGLANSNGDVIVFSDVDMVLAFDSIEKHVALHQGYDKIAVSCQRWDILGDAQSLNETSRFNEDQLIAISKPYIQDIQIVWSNHENIYRSKNWWAFLSGHSSFKRADIMRLNGWDPFFTGWGGEDNELGYRIILNGLDIIYCEHIKAFHIEHEISDRDRYTRWLSALRNIEYIRRKFPELTNYSRIIDRYRELIELKEGYEKAAPKDPNR